MDIAGMLFYLLTNPWLLLGGGFVAYITVQLVSFLRKEKGANPFENDQRRPPEPFVSDFKVRSSVIKNRFKSSNVPEDLDAIVIGSGIGGLTTAVLLGRAGKKVLVLDQLGKAGGCCHNFIKKGFEFDTGIHYIGNLQEGSDNRTLLDQLTEGQLHWSKMDDAFDSAVIGPSGKAKMFPMKSGRARYVQNLIDFFPKEEATIREYMRLIDDAGGSWFGFVLVKMLPRFVVSILVNTGLYRVVFSTWRKGYADVTLQETLDKLTDNAELKCVLSYLCFDYGVTPQDVPFMLHAGLIHHYMSGAYYPTNGSSEIAFHMCNVISKLGGCVMTKARISKILCNDEGRAVGVTVEGEKEKVDIHASIIISDAGVINTFKKLLPQEVAQKSCIYPLIETVGPSVSYITTFMGVEGSPSELNIPATNFWRYPDMNINKTFKDYMALDADEMEDADIPFSYISCPSAKDSESENRFPGKTSIISITAANYKWFKEWKDEPLRHRGERYEGIKDVIGRRMWQQCVELFPQIEGKRVYMEVGTPVTNSHYLGHPEGEMYGLNQDRKRFTIDAASKLRSDTDIPGLYLTGQDVMTCGFCSALFVGLICTSQILNRNVHCDLTTLQARLYPSEDKLKKTD